MIGRSESPLFEIARVLVRFEYVAIIIVTADYCIMLGAVEFRVLNRMTDLIIVQDRLPCGLLELVHDQSRDSVIRLKPRVHFFDERSLLFQRSF